MDLQSLILRHVHPWHDPIPLKTLLSAGSIVLSKLHHLELASLSPEVIEAILSIIETPHCSTYRFSPESVLPGTMPSTGRHVLSAYRYHAQHRTGEITACVGHKLTLDVDEAFSLTVDLGHSQTFDPVTSIPAIMDVLFLDPSSNPMTPEPTVIKLCHSHAARSWIEFLSDASRLTLDRWPRTAINDVLNALASRETLASDWKCPRLETIVIRGGLGWELSLLTKMMEVRCVTKLRSVVVDIRDDPFDDVKPAEASALHALQRGGADWLTIMHDSS